MKARVKRIPISPEILVKMMIGETSWIVSKGIPKTARLRGFTVDPYANVLNLFVEDKSFDEIDLGAVAPVLETLFHKL